jgi:DNA-binding response OmpR family regulator
MVIDENTAVVDLLSQMLTRTGLQVIGCSEFAKAEAVIHASLPSAVILELRRRNEYTSWSLLKALRTNPATQAIPLVVTSGDVALLRRYETDLMALGVSVLAKPFTIETLMARLAALMRTAELMTEVVAVTDGAPLEASWQLP